MLWSESIRIQRELSLNIVVCCPIFHWPPASGLTHWGRVMLICVSKLTTIGLDNGLSPGHQAIIWTNVGILLIWPLGTNFSEILIEIDTFSFRKIYLKMSSGKRRPSCLGLNVVDSDLKPNGPQDASPRYTDLIQEVFLNVLWTRFKHLR